MAEKLEMKELAEVAVRFSGDSGDGMQLAGNIFSTVSATVGNSISTFPLVKPHDYDVDYLITYDGEKDTAAKVAAVVETFNHADCKVRSVRLDELSTMEHKIKARKTLSLQEAEKEAAEI